MEGPAYGLKDGDAANLEMRKTNVAYYGINYTFYEDGQYHDLFDENGQLSDKVKEEVIITYHNPDGYVKDVWHDKEENGYITSELAAKDQKSGEVTIVHFQIYKKRS